MEEINVGADLRADMVDLLVRVVESQCSVLESLARAFEAQATALRSANEPAAPLPVAEIANVARILIDSFAARQARESGAAQTSGEG